MVPVLYKTITEGTVPTHYGIGALVDCLSCEVTEQRNGSYELAMVYTAKGIHAEDIEVNSFIKAKPNFMDEPQLFRIYKVGKVMNGRFTVSARHISYDLSGKIITGGSASSCVAACALLSSSAGNFIISTDKELAGAFSVSQPSSVRSWFGGKQGSILDVFGPGEWKYDNYTARFMAHRGDNRGVTIRYGKNLTELSQELDMSNLVTGIYPFYIDPNGNQTVGARVATDLTLDVVRDIAIDFSSDVDPESSTPIADQLDALANKYIQNNNLTTISNSITLNFVQMKDITERVDLCDTVNIYFEALGITASAKCVETTWDVLENRYTKTTFGDARTNIADTIAANSMELAKTPTRAEMNAATQLITGNLGGYVVLDDSDSDGKPDQILIMNTDDKDTATEVWRWNKSGLGYSSHGYGGPYELAMTSAGEINADFLKVGVITDQQENSSINMTNGEAIMNNLKAKRALILVDANGVERGQIKYTVQTGSGIFLREPSNQATVSIVAGTGNDATFGLFTSAGLSSVMAEVTSAGGHLLLYDGNNHRTLRLEGGDTYGGTVGVYNKNNRQVGSLMATGGGGYISVGDDAGTQTIYGYGSSGALVCVSLTQTSSRKVKKNIKPIADANKILELEAVSFDYKDEARGTDKRGFIAEDVAKVLPNLVTPEEDGRPASLDYIGMVPYLQAIIKEQNKRIEALEDKINKKEG